MTDGESNETEETTDQQQRATEQDGVTPDPSTQPTDSSQDPATTGFQGSNRSQTSDEPGQNEEPSTHEQDQVPNHGTSQTQQTSEGSEQPADQQNPHSPDNDDVSRLKSEIATLKQTIEQSQSQIDALETELEDYQRRNNREHEDIRKYAIADFAREMLKVKDMLRDAIEIEDFEEGSERRLRMVEKQFDKILTAGQIERIEPEEQDLYDDSQHRMVDKQPKPGYEADQIINVLEIGYRTHDRVIRPARVEVAATRTD